MLNKYFKIVNDIQVHVFKLNRLFKATSDWTNIYSQLSPG